MSDALPAASPSRAVRLIRRAAYVLFLLWFSWYAYERFTTPPAILTKRQANATVPDDVPFATAILTFRHQIATIAAGPAIPNVRFPPMTIQTSELSTFADKTWTQLQTKRPDVIAALVDPRVNDMLDRVVPFCAERLAGDETHRWRLPPGAVGGALDADEYDAAIVWLTFRARHRAHFGADPFGAVSDLRAALFLGELADITRDTQVTLFFGFRVPNILPLYEATCLPTEVELPPQATLELINVLRDALGLSLSGALSRRAVQADAAALLDRYYTDDGRGNGWLVLSAAGDRPWTRYGMTPDQNNRLWNLASCFFNDRKTMAARISGVSGRFDAFDRRSYPEIRRQISSDLPATEMELGGTIFDGPLAMSLGKLDTEQVHNAMIIVARRRAAIVMLALNAHFVEQGRFPEKLDELVPRYLEAVPLDANANLAFRYERRSEQYKLGTSAQTTPHLATQWWYPIKFPEETYVPDRELPRLKYFNER